MNARIVTVSCLFTALAIGCAQHTELLGSGASLTSTPCDTCAPADQPALSCSPGQAPGCFQRTDGACGWKAVCVTPRFPGVDAAACPAIGCGGDCPYGVFKDANGCPTCNCIPGDAGVACPTLACANQCPAGFVKDANGCSTCACQTIGCTTEGCSTGCPRVFVTDSTGCAVCACRVPPSTSEALCEVDKCTEPLPPVAYVLCADGVSRAGPVCVPVPDGECAWTVLSCPDVPPPLPATCPDEKCPGTIPPYVPYTCADGKTVAGPRCVPDAATGTCAWTVVSCP